MQFIEYWAKREKPNGCEYTVYLLTAWLIGSCSSLPLPNIARGCITQNATSLGKKSGFEVGFLLDAYCVHTVLKLKNHTLNHYKSIRIPSDIKYSLV